MINLFTVGNCNQNVSLDVAELLRVAEKLSVVNVEEMAAGLQHNVVVVPVADAQHVGHHTVSRTRS